MDSPGSSMLANYLTSFSLYSLFRSLFHPIWLPWVLPIISLQPEMEKGAAPEGIIYSLGRRVSCLFHFVLAHTPTFFIAHLPRVQSLHTGCHLIFAIDYHNHDHDPQETEAQRG